MRMKRMPQGIIVTVMVKLAEVRLGTRERSVRPIPGSRSRVFLKNRPLQIAVRTSEPVRM
jgi:hypothetical protein